LPQKLAYAAFLSRVGSPADAVRLSAEAASLPVTAKNAEANAVLGDALSRLGKLPEALARLDAVLAFDPGNATALRGRAELELRANRAAAAVTDAEKLVSVLPRSASDRLLLARSYAAAGNNAWRDRTLWRAFQDIPGDEKIFAALLESRKNNTEATQQLRDEFERQREQNVGRGIF
jgi:predicted Zn-dependent protease